MSEQRHPWIMPGNVSAEENVRDIDTCSSNVLKKQYKKGE